MNNKLNVVYHSSDLFASVLGTSMLSLLENNKSFDEIHIYIFENPLSSENKDKLSEIAKEYGRKLHFIEMPDVNELENLGLKDVRAGWFFNSYMKLYLDELLPADVKRVLYLDSDILVVGDLTEFWNMDLQGHCAAGVIDCLGEKYYDVLGLSNNARYCNSGMILEDLVAWKKAKIGDRVRDYCKKNGGYVFFMEQTAFNAALDGEILIIDPKYNVYSMMLFLSYNEMMDLRKVKRFYKPNEIQKAVENPAIIHLTNSFMLSNRAWYENSNHPCHELYNEYKSMTPWKSDHGFEDKRTFKQKTIQFFVDNLPRKIVIIIAEKLYNGWRVEKIRKTIRNAQNKAEKERLGNE